MAPRISESTRRTIGLSAGRSARPPRRPRRPPRAAGAAPRWPAPGARRRRGGASGASSTRPRGRHHRLDGPLQEELQLVDLQQVLEAAEGEDEPGALAARSARRRSGPAAPAGPRTRAGDRRGAGRGDRRAGRGSRPGAGPAPRLPPPPPIRAGRGMPGRGPGFAHLRAMVAHGKRRACANAPAVVGLEVREVPHVASGAALGAGALMTPNACQDGEPARWRYTCGDPVCLGLHGQARRSRCARDKAWATSASPRARCATRRTTATGCSSAASRIAGVLACPDLP